MEYIWVSLLNRSEVLFWESTPKILFEQYDIYKKVNGLEEKKEENKEEKPQETAIEQEAPKQTVVEEDDEKAPTPEELRSRPTQQAVNPYLPRNEISFAPRQPQQQESMPQPMQGDNTTEQQSAGNQSGTDTDKENSQFSSRWNQ